MKYKAVSTIPSIMIEAAGCIFGIIGLYIEIVSVGILGIIFVLISFAEREVEVIE